MLWNHYAPVKLNKGKVFPHEGQLRTWERKCRQMSKSWRWFGAVWFWYLTQILWLQKYKYMISLSRALSAVSLLAISISPVYLSLSLRAREANLKGSAQRAH